METPDVLVRKEIELPKETEELIKELQTFSYGSYVGIFSVSTSSITFKEQNEDPNFEAIIVSTLNKFEQLGLKNIITKQEEFVTQSGVKGLKTYGSGSFGEPDGDSKKAKYNILSFGGKGFIQQIVITWEDGDEYAEEIVERILTSLDVKTQA